MFISFSEEMDTPKKVEEFLLKDTYGVNKIEEIEEIEEIISILEGPPILEFNFGLENFCKCTYQTISNRNVILWSNILI